MNGHVAGIFRHPVKGFTPEPLREVELAPGQGFPHDRIYAVENGPSGFDPASIDISTLRLAGSVPTVPKSATLGDHDANGVSDLMVKFNRKALDPLLTPGVNELEVTGSLVTGMAFQGSDEVRVIDPGAVHSPASAFSFASSGRSADSARQYLRASSLSSIWSSHAA